MSLPGLWSAANVTESSRLPNAEPPNLMVAHIYPNRVVRYVRDGAPAPTGIVVAGGGAGRRALAAEPEGVREVAAGTSARLREPQSEPPPKRPVGLGRGKMEADGGAGAAGGSSATAATGNSAFGPAFRSGSPFSGFGGAFGAPNAESASSAPVINLIEDRELIGSFNVWNGYAHVINELPVTDKFDPLKALWDCVHEFCFECPKLAGHLLQFFDEGGLLPSDKPLEFVVPPGPRPEWVCKGAGTWFPPGWSPPAFARYVRHARQGDARAPAEALAGGVDAAARLAALRERLDFAKFQLKQIKTLSYLETQNVRPLWDPQALISIGSAKFLLEEIPRCKKHDDAIKVTMQDLQYIGRWMAPPAEPAAGNGGKLGGHSHAGMHGGGGKREALAAGKRPAGHGTKWR